MVSSPLQSHRRQHIAKKVVELLDEEFRGLTLDKTKAAALDVLTDLMDEYGIEKAVREYYGWVEDKEG